MVARILIVGEADHTAGLRVLIAERAEVSTIADDAVPAAIAGHGVDLLVVTVDTPVRKRLRELARLRAAAVRYGVPILALVARDNPLALIKAFDLGAADCAGLPLDAGEINARVAALLRRKRATDALSAEARESRTLAQTDAVTGLYNRHYFDSQLGALVGRARDRATPLAVMILDIDTFKPINDQFGHAAGDATLRAVAAQLTANVRASDAVVRYGGDELVVLMPDTDQATAQRIAERLRKAVSEVAVELPAAIKARGATLIRLTVSIGVAALEPADRDGLALLARADAALFVAKRAGRNRVVMADSAAA
jgi:two-component system cell cycle response regulator